MNEQKYQNQTLTEYLLGSLPDPEAERFDELSFTDEEFADALKDAENNLIDAYIHDEMAGAMLEKFESHYLASPLRREKINFARAFQSFAKRDGIAAASEDDLAAGSGFKSRIAGFFSAFDIFAAPNLAVRWSLAAVGVMIIALGGFWLVSRSLNDRSESDLQAKRELPAQAPSNKIQSENTTPATEKDAAQTKEENAQPPQTPKKEPSQKPPAPPTEKPPVKEQRSTARTVVAFVLAPPLRGAGQIQALSIPKQTGEVAIRLPLESDDYASYQVTLSDQTGDENLWTRGKIKTRSKAGNKALNIRFPAKLLKSRIYTLVVAGINSNGETEIIADYPFRAVIK